MPARLRSPFEAFSAIRDQLTGGGTTLVALDFDGTLTEIVDDPAAPGLSGARRALLARIPSAGRRLVVASGRALADLRQRVGIPGAILIGNHGLEIEGPEIHERPEARVAEGLAAVLAEAGPRLERALHVRGGADAWIEDKRWTATVHTRPREDGRLHAEIGSELEPAVPPGYVLRPGKATWEIRPAAGRDKGAALLRVIEALPGFTARSTFYAGDDATDEDAFRALEDGVTVRVGDGSPTAARYGVAGPAKLYELLALLFLNGAARDEA